MSYIFRATGQRYATGLFQRIGNETSSVQTSYMSGLDWFVIAIYFLVIGVVAWWYGRHQKNSVDYFLAGRNAEIGRAHV